MRILAAMLLLGGALAARHRRRHVRSARPTLLPTAAPSPSPDAEYEYERLPATGAPTPLPSLPSYSGADCPAADAEALAMFRRVETLDGLCQLVELRGPFEEFYTFEGFNCSVSACVALCADDSACQYALYSQAAQKCTKATDAIVTDDPLAFPAYKAAGYEAFVLSLFHGGPSIVPYYAGFCSQLLPSDCNKYKQCGWDKGERGYNDYSLGGHAGGWCGRVSCTPGML